MAVNCWLDPSGTEIETGEIVIAVMAGWPTARDVDAVTCPNVAVIFAVPTPAVVANPLDPELLLMTATCVVEEAQVTSDVTSCVPPSV